MASDAGCQRVVAQATMGDGQLLPADFESFSIDVERLIDAGSVVVVQAHYVATGKATGESVRAAVAHVLEILDGKIVRFDQYVDSATINPVIGA